MPVCRKESELRENKRLTPAPTNGRGQGTRKPVLTARLQRSVVQRQPLSTLPLSQLSVQRMWEESKRRGQWQRDTREGQGAYEGMGFAEVQHLKNEKFHSRTNKASCSKNSLFFNVYSTFCFFFTVSFFLPTLINKACDNIELAVWVGCTFTSGRF